MMTRASDRSGERRPAPGNEAVRVHVYEHAHYDRLDYELRALLDLLAEAPRGLFILNFLDPRSRAEDQIVLVYQSARRRLKRLHQRLAPGSPSECRLEVWSDLGPEEIRRLAESAFVEETRPDGLQPEVFLGALESLIDRGGF